jgi:hypothetical protein
MQPIEIKSSRWKLALYLGGSLAFVAIAIFIPAKPQDTQMMQLGGFFFGLCALAFMGLLVRPQSLRLDPEGFTVGGGLNWRPRKILWHDVERFFVYTVGRGTKMVGYNYKPGVRPERAISFNARAFGADGAIPKAFPWSPQRMADELNSYRLKAANGESPQPSI